MIEYLKCTDTCVSHVLLQIYKWKVHTFKNVTKSGPKWQGPQGCRIVSTFCTLNIAEWVYVVVVRVLNGKNMVPYYAYSILIFGKVYFEKI